jgi:hypothetical protein
MAEISAQAATKKDAKEITKQSKREAAMERRLREEAGAEAVANAEEDVAAEIAQDEAYLRDSLEAAFASDDDDESESEMEMEEDGNKVTPTLGPRKVESQPVTNTCCPLTSIDAPSETQQDAEKAPSNGRSIRSHRDTKEKDSKRVCTQRQMLLTGILRLTTL